MSRKLIRPELKGHDAAPRPPRRQAPPESTHAEAGYLLHAIESRSPFVARLLGGAELRGRVESHDRDALGLLLDDGRSILLRKSKIKYYWVERG